MTPSQQPPGNGHEQQGEDELADQRERRYRGGAADGDGQRVSVAEVDGVGNAAAGRQLVAVLPERDQGVAGDLHAYPHYRIGKRALRNDGDRLGHALVDGERGGRQGYARQRVVVNGRAPVTGAGIDGFGRPQPQGELVVQRVGVLHGVDGQLEGIARGEYRVFVESRRGVVQRRNGGGLAAADALGLYGDLAERVDGLLARRRLTAGALAGGAGRPSRWTIRPGPWAGGLP